MSWCDLRLCCHPLPGEQIVGFITRGRGVTVHTVGCPTVLESDPHRKIEVSWEENGQTAASGKNRSHLRRSAGTCWRPSAPRSPAPKPISRARRSELSRARRALNTFEVMIKNSEHLKRVLQNISKVKGVYKAVRGRGQDRRQSGNPSSSRRKRLQLNQ